MRDDRIIPPDWSKPPIPEVAPLPDDPAPQRGSQWGCGMLLLWVYSLVATGFFLVLLVVAQFEPPAPPSATPEQDAIVAGLLFLPVFVFVLLVGVRNFKRSKAADQK